MKWNNLPNVIWAKQHLFKVKKLTANNCVFVIAVVDLIFDVNIQTTTLTGGMIVQRMNEKLNEKVFSFD